MPAPYLSVPAPYLFEPVVFCYRYFLYKTFPPWLMMTYRIFTTNFVNYGARVDEPTYKWNV